LELTIDAESLQSSQAQDEVVGQTPSEEVARLFQKAEEAREESERLERRIEQLKKQIEQQKRQLVPGGVQQV
jgi:uncharacterized coiled-coil DUF342 family protein